MGDEGIFATTAEVVRKAGSGASATSVHEDYVNDYMTQVEAFINVFVKYNFSDNYAALNVDVKGVLKEIASNLAAIYVISYDLNGYPTRYDAETLMTVLYRRAKDGLRLLLDQDKVTFMKKA